MNETFTGVHQGLRPWNLDFDHYWRNLLVSNINYVLDPTPPFYAPPMLDHDLSQKFMQFRNTPEGARC